MRAETRHVFVVDVESTCWETEAEQGSMPNEVIEIGICRLDMKTGAITEKGSYRVSPQRSTISEFCTRLTGWTADMIAGAPTMPYVLSNIQRDYRLGRDNLWFSFGEYDRVKLSSTPGEKGGVHHLYGIEYSQNPFAQMKHFNVKTLMMLKERLAKGMSMDRSLTYYGLQLEGRHHNGADDAYNIAKIVHRVLS